MINKTCTTIANVCTILFFIQVTYVSIVQNKLTHFHGVLQKVSRASK